MSRRTKAVDPAVLAILAAHKPGTMPPAEMCYQPDNDPFTYIKNEFRGYFRKAARGPRGMTRWNLSAEAKRLIAAA